MLNSVKSWISLCLALFICQQYVECRRVDCTKYIFAPACRGIAAKRSERERLVSGLRGAAGQFFQNRMNSASDRTEIDSNDERPPSLIDDVMTSEQTSDRSRNLPRPSSLRSHLYPLLLRLSEQLQASHRPAVKALRPLQRQWLYYLLNSPGGQAQ